MNYIFFRNSKRAILGTISTVLCNPVFEYKVFEVDLSLSLFELPMYHSVKVLLCM
jgi:hypothetical protein